MIWQMVCNKETLDYPASEGKKLNEKIFISSKRLEEFDWNFQDGRGF